MGSLSIWHWLIYIFFIVVLGIPIARILTRIAWRAPHMSVFGGKADMTIALRNVRL